LFLLHGLIFFCDGGGHSSDSLMAGNERERGLQRPVTICGMGFGVTDAAGLGLYQNLTRAGTGNVPLLQREGLTELLDNGDLRLLCPAILLFTI